MAATAFNAFWDGPDKFSFGMDHFNQSNSSPPTLCEDSDQLFANNQNIGVSSTHGGNQDQLFSTVPYAELEDSTANANMSEDRIVDQQGNCYSVEQYDEQRPFITSPPDCESQMEHNTLSPPLLSPPPLSSSPPSPPVSPSASPKSPPPSTFQSSHTNQPESHVQPHYFYMQQLSQYEHIPPPLSYALNNSDVLQTTTSPVKLAPSSMGAATDAILLSAQSTSPLPISPSQTNARQRRVRNFECGNARLRGKRGGEGDLHAEEEQDSEKGICCMPNCLVCNRELPECLHSAQPSWATILRVVFYTLKVNHPQKEFFNLRSHVYDFVDTHWNQICIGKIKSEHWKKQLQDTLAHNKKLFVSGADVFKQKGFWRLECLTDPWEERTFTNSNPLLFPRHARAQPLAAAQEKEDEEDGEYSPHKPPYSRRQNIKRVKIE